MLVSGAIVCAAILLTALAVPAHAANPEIPQWIKQIALLWGNSQISDAEFVSALQYLIQEGILVVPESEFMTAVADSGHAPANLHPDAKQGNITKIVDGDTVHINGISYRLSLIDTPERGEEGFQEATNTLEELCQVGSKIYYDDDSIQLSDRYGRHLGVIWCSGNDYATTAGEYMSENGYLKRFYMDFCDTTETATKKWAEASGNWFYHKVCN